MMALRFVLAVIFFGLSFVEANILIESRDEQLANSAQTLLRVRVFNSVKEIAYHESYTIQNGDRLKTLKVHSGGTLFIAPGEMFVGSIQLESGSKVHFVNPGQRTVLHLNGSAVWRAQNTNENLGHVAKGFMLIQHGSEAMAVEGMWAGTIFAPTADLILGQSSKKLHGRFLGKDITVHQYATVYHVKFEPENALELVRRGK